MDNKERTRDHCCDYDQLLFDFDEADFRENITSTFDNSFRSLDVIREDASTDDDEPFLEPETRHLTAADENIAGGVTLENLKNLYNSCFTCGVNWHDEHVSLDCLECGGYSLRRPCPICDGLCRREWKRDVARSHELNKAQWQGECGISVSDNSLLNKMMTGLVVTSS